MTPATAAGLDSISQRNWRTSALRLRGSPPLYRGLRLGSGAIFWPMLCALAFLLALLPAPLRAQVGVTHTWAAKVDEEWITHHDVEQRAKLIRFEGRAKNLSQARKQAQEELIDEALQLKEIKKLKLEPTKKDVEDQIERIAKTRRSSKSKLYQQLKAAGVGAPTLEKRVKTQLGWSNVLRKRHGSKILPSDTEIAERLKKAPKTPEGPVVYQIGQIMVDLPPNAQPLHIAVAQQEAERARKEFTSCAVTKTLAKKYSKRFPGASGEIVKSRMAPPLQKVILPLKPGQTTPPLRTRGGFMIFRLCSREKKGGRKLKPEEIKRVLYEEKINQYSRLELNDMRRDALIERAQ